jgi:ATP-binding cassette subfamily C protein
MFHYGAILSKTVLVKKLGYLGYFRHILKCFYLLSIKARIMFTAILVFQTLVSMLDIIGLAIIMKIVLGLQSESRVIENSMFGSLPFLGRLSSSIDPQVLLIFVAGVFITKGFLALFLHTLNIRMMGGETKQLVKKLSKEVFENRTGRYSHFTSHDISYTIHNATEIVFRDTLVPFSIIIADAALLVLIGLNLFLSTQALFVPIVLYFLLIFITLRHFEKRITKSAYSSQWQSEVRVRRQIQEVHSSLRELYVSNKLNEFIEKINESRSNGIKSGVIVSTAYLRPKYFYEIALFGGIGMIALVSKYSGSEPFLLTYLAIFLVSSSRTIPSLLRTQYYLGILQKSAEQSKKIFEILQIIDNNSKSESYKIVNHKLFQNEKVFSPHIKAEFLTFFYSDDQKSPTISDLSLDIYPGETVAIVGNSGAGKSTLVDLLLGYQSPHSGKVSISGLDPRVCFNIWPGKVAYVPQKVTIFEGTLFENIAIGVLDHKQSSYRDEAIKLLLGVGLGEFLQSLTSGLDTQLSESGSNISGGQVQRIGIARALFTNPEIIVFDESTSSLDSVSEQEIMDFLYKFRGEKSLIFIAHRLSTIKNADRILYLNGGKIEAEGSFESLQKSVPEFSQQVLLQNFGNNT